MHAKKEKTCPAYVSKHNSNRDKQVILLMTPNGEERGRKAKSKEQWWHYLAVKKLSALLTGLLLSELSSFL